jgi:hypothetical protein
MARFITGTIAQLNGKLKLNGVVLGQPELSVMTRIFGGTVFKQVGIVRREGERGRPAIIWNVDTETAAWFEVSDADVTNGLTASDDAPVEFVATPAATVAAA